MIRLQTLVLAMLFCATVNAQGYKTFDQLKSIFDDKIDLNITAIQNQQNAAKLSKGHYDFKAKDSVLATPGYYYQQRFHEYPDGWLGVYSYYRQDTIMVKVVVYAGDAVWRNMDWTYFASDSDWAMQLRPPGL